MISEHQSPDSLDDAIMQALIAGWAKSRAGHDVSVTHEEGYTHCVFKSPIGSQSRDRESFYWRSREIIESAQMFHKGKYHYLSIFGNDALTEPVLARKGYKFLVKEMLMYRPVRTEMLRPIGPVKRVQTVEDAEWYNRQRGRTFIRSEHLNDTGVYDFYTCHGELLTSYARAIHQENLFIVDDVQTHPDYRRQGLGSRLLAAIAAAASRAGACGLILIASQSGIPLYLKENYSAIAPLRVYCPSNELSD